MNWKFISAVLIVLRMILLKHSLVSCESSPIIQVAANDRWCIRCICEFKSGCNATVGCGDFDCGMFKMTSVYWEDAGKPTVNHEDSNLDDAFLHCATNQHCSEVTVANYLEKFSQDCNKDGVIDCIDYAMIHQFGGYSCNLQRKLEEKDVQKINECMKRSSSTH